MYREASQIYNVRCPFVQVYMHASMLLTEGFPCLLFLFSALFAHCSEWRSFYLTGVSKCQLQIRHVCMRSQSLGVSCMAKRRATIVEHRVERFGTTKHDESRWWIRQATGILIQYRCPAYMKPFKLHQICKHILKHALYVYQKRHNQMCECVTSYMKITACHLGTTRALYTRP
jgi:hypothetical protein